MPAFDGLDGLFGKVGDVFGLGDAQGFALGGAPAFQPVRDLPLIALVGGLVEVGPEDFLGKILLGEEVVWVVVGVLVALAVAEGFGVPVAILEVIGHFHLAFFFDQLIGFEI